METLLFIILIFMVGGWLLRRLAPYILLHVFKRLASRQGSFYQAPPRETNSRQEGEVKVDRQQSQKKKKIKQEIGEYVDFEDVQN